MLVVSLAVVGCGESVQGPTGEELEPMPLYPMIDQCPAWSPDGDTIAYYHYGITSVAPDGGTHIDRDLEGIWFVDPDGSNPRLFLKGAGQPTWSASGDMLAFSHASDKQIFTVRADGTGLTQLTDHGCNLMPDWSPRMNLIAYVSDVDADIGFYICMIYFDGSLTWSYNAKGLDPDWSPDMRHMVYTNNENEIWRITVGGGMLDPVTHFAASCADPAYSPDGERIAFACFASYGSTFPLYSQIFVMEAYGSDRVQLTTRGGVQPCWSPDGSRIAYVCRRPQEYSSQHGTIWVMNDDGSDARQITTSPVPE
jgi:Tol biopolymer transport system component